MSRWIARAARKVMEAKASAGVLSDTGYIGSAIDWVAPRVLPLFVAGYNWLGLGLLLIIVAAVAGIFMRRRERPLSLTWLSVLAVSAILASFAYVGIIGRGSAKITYFACVLPIFLTWTSSILSHGIQTLLPVRFHAAGILLVAGLLAAALFQPAWQMTRLDGKPKPYSKLRDALDAHLPAGSVAIIDRWFEPWNEMTRYAPSNVAVTFTVPDEPFDNYVNLRWRDVTRARIEAGGVDAFIRLVRNHEERLGLWTWPESWFPRRIAVSNAAAYWIRDRGYAPDQDFDLPNEKYLKAEIFYETREDALARAARHQKPFAVFYGADLPYEKSGPVGFLRFRTQQFMDWRVLAETGSFDVFNLANEPVDAAIEISAISPFGAKTFGLDKGPRIAFPAGQFLTASLGTVTLQPGLNRLTLRDIGQSAASVPLYISEIRIKPAGGIESPQTTGQ